MSLSPEAADYVLAFADDEHAIGARHANWIGRGPFLEEDLAFCSIAQDELGHALALYEFLMAPEEIDRFVLLRDPEDYRSCALTEAHCPAWHQALVRHWLYDRAEHLRWAALAQSTIPELSELAIQAEREESFHRAHAEMMMSRVCGETSSRTRIQSALDELSEIARSVWSPPDHEDVALTQGVVAVSSAEMEKKWIETIDADCVEWGLEISWGNRATADGRKKRIDEFDEFHASLGEVMALDPAARW